jgi:peptide/nickel transport system permease protein
MLKLLLRRLGISAAQLVALTLCVFALSSFMPGDALTGRIAPNITGERLAELRALMGMDAPWAQRYARWVLGALRGDFGISYTHQVAVTALARDKAVNTLFLGLCSLILCYLMAVPLGAMAGRHAGRLPDRAVSAFAYALMSAPQMAIGLILLFLFSYAIHWFPIGGSAGVAVTGGFFAHAADRLWRVVLPALSSALFNVPPLVLLLRTEIIATERSAFIEALNARGIGQRRLFYRHTLRNSLIPLASTAGELIAALLSGVVLVEMVFSYPGMGKLFVDSVLKRDYPTVNFLILVFGVLAILGALASDLLLNRLDPRIKVR